MGAAAECPRSAAGRAATAACNRRWTQMLRLELLPPAACFACLMCFILVPSGMSDGPGGGAALGGC